MLTSNIAVSWRLKFNRSDETRTETLRSFDQALDRAGALIEQENTTLLELAGPRGERLDGDAILKALHRPLRSSHRVSHA